MSKERRLSGKQKAFINAYLGEANYNATKAARLAGYKGNGDTLSQIGYKMVRNGQIAKEISIRHQESAMNADEVLKRLGEQARAEYSQFILSDGTVDIKSLIDAGKAHLIKGVTPLKDGNRIDFYDGQSALNTLAKHHGLLTDKLEIKIKDELSQAIDLLENNLSKEVFDNVLKILAGTG